MRQEAIGINILSSRPYWMPDAPEDKPMWNKPKIVEIAVGMEINAYACADLD